MMSLIVEYGENEINKINVFFSGCDYFKGINRNIIEDEFWEDSLNNK